ncbi:MAG: DNA polymerase III subunit alpha [Deferribacteraceae bacterium]|jgi:DNA polymerase-3 subunit alpha|nr:DNA polymerase III subunit alpha [Deferribacteraceae bacterium]
MTFTHLHLHTQYSLLDGAILIDKLIPKAKEYGMKSIAITDHGVMFGVIDFYNQCKKAGIKPILGCEVYVSPTSRHEREYARGETSNYHLILLAENDKGFQNLCKLASIAQLEGFYRKPRIDKEVLAQHHEGLIALSACLGGEIPQKIMTGNFATARDAAVELNNIMGEGNFYLEIQQNGIPEQTAVNKQLLNISEETGIPLVATCDCHYLNKGDHRSHNILMYMQTQSTISKPNSMETPSEELYFKSPEEMYRDFASYPVSALENTDKIAERCNVTIDFSQIHMPNYPIPEGFTAESYFRHLSEEGLKERLKRVPEDKHATYYERLAMEMDVIALKGYVGYFLIVWDFINYSKENGVPVGPGRGSGAGSLVAYSLRITDIDPIELNLLFERFLNPERPSLPDFDIDFCIRGRAKVIEYVREKYGKDHVAQIATFSKLSGRSIVRDVSRVLEIPLPIADKLAKTIPGTPGMTLSTAVHDDPAIKATFEDIPEGAELLRHSLNLEGLLRQTGMHAAGVVIADKPLMEYLPLARGTGEGNDVLVQYEKGLVEKLGFVKFDFLGLANLTIIDDAVNRIKRQCDPDFDIAKIRFDDPDVYKMLSNGDSSGVFQFESDGMRRLMRKLQPSVLEDLIALNALYRPGPIESGMLDDFCDRKHGIQQIIYPLPQLESVLKETYGIIVYQEQVMEIARVVAGYSLGSADILRRAMGKKDAKEMERQKGVFIEGDEEMGVPGARKLGNDVKIAAEIFDLMEKFANYGFNKSHSAAYAVLAYQTAYLKCKYPAQFICAAMSMADGKLEDVIHYIDDARQLGIEVRPPDINRSGVDFEYIDGAIWFGLKAIKGVGGVAVEAMIAERNANGAYKSIYDLCLRADLRVINKKVLESLIYAGAFDSFGKNRRQHLQVMESCMEQGQKKSKMKEQGLMSIEDFLFGGDDEEEVEEFYPDLPEMTDSELLSKEKSVLSIYFTSHPVQSAVDLAGDAFDSAAYVNELPTDTPVKLLALAKTITKRRTNKNDPTKKQEDMAVMVMEDLTGTVEAVVFPRTYNKYMEMLIPESIMVVDGTWKRRDERASIEVKEIYSFAEGLERLTKGLAINIDLPSTDDEDIDKLHRTLQQHSGGMPVTLRMHRKDDYTLELPLLPKHAVLPTEAFFRQVDELCGKKSYEIISDRVVSSGLKYESFYTADEVIYDEENA